MTEIKRDNISIGAFELTIFNAVGKEVYSDTFNETQNTFHLNLPPGLYYCKMNGDGGKNYLKKFIIQ